MRLLVTGAGGTVGGRLAELLARRGHDVTGVVRQAAAASVVRAIAADLGEPDRIEEVLDASRPEAVLHCAAFSNADACEREPAVAERLNVLLPGWLGRGCRRRGVRLISVSTDLVLDGGRPLSTEADDVPASALVYGRTKRAGERAVLGAWERHVVLRIPLMVGRGHGARGTSSETVLWALRAGRRPRLFTDQFRSPTDPESLAELVELCLASTAAGLFHGGGGERVSRYELGVRVARLFGLDPAAIVATTAAEQAVPRPRDASLDSSRAVRELGWRPRALDEALAESRPQPAGGATSASRS
jgi:dTDP-4-dehydrorhamnose reductase